MKPEAKSKSCLVCSEQHRTAECLMFTLLSASDRFKLIRQSRRCFSCLESGHESKFCRRQSRCSRDGCRQLHHPLLHEACASVDSDDQLRSEDSAPKLNVITIKTASLFIVPVRICANGKHVDTCALIDSGSSATLLEGDIADALDLKGSSGEMFMSGMCGLKKDQKSKLVQFAIASRCRSFTFHIPRAFVVQRLNLGLGEVDPAALAKRWSHLKDLHVQSTVGQQVKVVIGIDIAGAHEIFQTIFPSEGIDGPRAIDTPFGWIVVGQIENPFQLVEKDAEASGSVPEHAGGKPSFQYRFLSALHRLLGIFGLAHQRDKSKSN